VLLFMLFVTANMHAQDFSFLDSPPPPPYCALLTTSLQIWHMQSAFPTLLRCMFSLPRTFLSAKFSPGKRTPAINFLNVCCPCYISLQQCPPRDIDMICVAFLSLLLQGLTSWIHLCCIPYLYYSLSTHWWSQ
jgi:hypothetical protein